MFNRALFRVEDYYNPHTVCEVRGDVSIFSEVPLIRGVRHPERPRSRAGGTQFM
jgi:hypothetical protein